MLGGHDQLIHANTLSKVQAVGEQVMILAGGLMLANPLGSRTLDNYN